MRKTASVLPLWTRSGGSLAGPICGTGLVPVFSSDVSRMSAFVNVGDAGDARGHKTLVDTTNMQ
jgi:hypothetical protein